MLNDWNTDYAGPHGNLVRKLREVESLLGQYARRELQHATNDDSGHQALADERSSLYREAARLVSHAEGVLERIEDHVKENQPKQS